MPPDGLISLSRKIIRQAIKDAARQDDDERLQEYFGGDAFKLHLIMSGYPQELHDTVADLMLIFGVARLAMIKELLELLNDWENPYRKKNPGQ